MRILSNGAKFMLVDRPLLPAYIFLATVVCSYRLGALCGLPKISKDYPFFADVTGEIRWKKQHFHRNYIYVETLIHWTY